MFNRRGFLFFSGATLAVASAGVLMPIRAWKRWITKDDLIGISNGAELNDFMRTLPGEFFLREMKVELPEGLELRKRQQAEIVKLAPVWQYGPGAEIINTRGLDYTPRYHDLHMATMLSPHLDG